MKRAELLQKYPDSYMLERIAFSRAKYRCRQKDGHFYRYYGSKNIGIEFKTFDDFFAEIGPMPDYVERWQLDRIDNKKSYMKRNVRWATRRTNCNNKESNLFFYFLDKKIHLNDICSTLNLDTQRVASRIRRGWTVLQALTTPKILPTEPWKNIIK